MKTLELNKKVGKSGQGGLFVLNKAGLAIFSWFFSQQKIGEILNSKMELEAKKGKSKMERNVNKNLTKII